MRALRRTFACVVRVAIASTALLASVSCSSQGSCSGPNDPGAEDEIYFQAPVAIDAGVVTFDGAVVLTWLPYSTDASNAVVPLSDCSVCPKPSGNDQALRHCDVDDQPPAPCNLGTICPPPTWKLTCVTTIGACAL